MTKTRFLFTLSSLVVTLVVYLLYTLVLVPMLLPTRERAKPIDMPVTTEKDMALLAKIFPKGSWVFDNPNSLSFQPDAKGGMILFKNMETLDNGQIKVSPCAVLLFPDDEALTSEERYRQAIVLEASNYAILEVDGGLGMPGGMRFKNGKLAGVVTIRSNMKKLDQSDDLMLVTQDVTFDYNLIQTIEPVDFQFGLNKGNGRHLMIELTNTDSKKKGQMPNMVKRIELRQLEKLRLYVESNKNSLVFQEPQTSPVDHERPTRHMVAYPQSPNDSTNPLQLETIAPGSRMTQNRNTTIDNQAATGQQTQGVQIPGTPTASQFAGNANINAPPSSNTEVLITCKSNVDMVPNPADAAQWVLTFREQVDVIRINPIGAADQLNCQELQVFFGAKPNTITGTASTSTAGNNTTSPNATPEKPTPLGNFSSMSPLRLEAIGAPVIVSSPENKGFKANARKLTVDLIRNELQLTQGDAVSVTYDQFKIFGKALYYWYDPNGGIGRLEMPNAGTIEGQTEGNNPQPFKLVWHDQLTMQPDKEHPELSGVYIRGDLAINLQGVGSATAEEAYLCFASQKNGNTSQKTTPNGEASPQMNIVLKNALMQKNVILKTENGECYIRELVVNFIEQQAQNTSAIQQQNQPVISLVAYRTFAGQSPSPQNASTSTKLSLFGNGKNANKSTFNIRAEKMEVQAFLVGKETTIDQIILTRNVDVQEKLDTQSGDEPIHLTGQSVHLRKPDSLAMSATILGDNQVHALFQGRGIVLIGANINIDRAGNTFWIDGQGQLRASQTAMSNASTSTSATSTSTSTSSSLGKLFANTANTTGSKNQAIIVDWKGGMVFNGQRQLVTFSKEVDVTYSLGSINKSDEVILRLSKPFQFFENDNPDDIELELVTIKGNIDIERDSHAADNSGQLSHDHIRCTALEINPNTGYFKGYGPGFVESIFRANLASGSTSSALGGSLLGARTGQNDAFQSGLKFLHCSFNGSVEGNYNASGSTFNVAFNNRVRTVLYPAQTFRDVVNVNNAKDIVSKGMLLECNKLMVGQKMVPGNSNAMIELKTSGNTSVEFAANGKNLIANADQIVFDQSKNLLTFEGNNFAEAILYESANASAKSVERARGKKFDYNVLTNEVRGEVTNSSFLTQ